VGSRASWSLTPIGIDIGGSKWLVATIRGDGAIEVLARGDSTAAPVRCLTALASALEPAHATSPCAIVCAFAGSVDSSGRVLRWPNRPSWEGFPFVEQFTNLTGRHVRVEDDGICAGYGELSFKTIPESRRFLCLSLGTGVASGVFMGGRAQRSQRASSFSLGHVRVGGRHTCSCGRKGCLQAEVQAVAVGGDGDRLVRVAQTVADIAALLDLDDVVLTGGLLQDDRLRSVLEPKLRRECGALSVRVVVSPCPELSAIAGAVALAAYPPDARC